MPSTVNFYDPAVIRQGKQSFLGFYTNYGKDLYSNTSNETYSYYLSDYLLDSLQGAGEAGQLDMAIAATTIESIVEALNVVRQEDNISQLKEVRMEVDGKWLRCSRRKNNYYYYVDNHFPTGKHIVTIKATDGNGNVALKKFTLIR